MIKLVVLYGAMLYHFDFGELEPCLKVKAYYESKSSNLIAECVDLRTGEVHR